MTDEGTVPVVDPSALPLDDPAQQERWSVTLDALPRNVAEDLYRHLKGAGIAGHIQVVSPRFSLEGHTFMGAGGLFEVCVRQEDLKRACDICREAFPGEEVEEGRLWGPSHVGQEPAVLCELSWHDSWDLAAQLNRAGLHAIVLPGDFSDPAPPAEESILEEIGREAKEEVEKLLERDPPPTPVEDRIYEVVVEKPSLDKAAAIAAQMFGDRFRLDGSAYDG